MSNELKSRLIAITLTVAVPLFFYRAAVSTEAYFRSLQARGVQTKGVVTELTGSGDSLYVHYAYTVNAVRYTGSVGAQDAPGTVGVPVTVTYLPERPEKNRVGPPITEEVIQAQAGKDRTAMALALGIFGFWTLVNEVRIRREPQPDGTLGRPLWGPRTGAILCSILMLAILFSLNVDPKVRAIDEKAFGMRPLGMPIYLFATAVMAFLFAPLGWVIHHLFQISRRARADGRHLRGASGLLWYLLRLGRLHPEMRKSQAVVAGGLMYVILLTIAWIAYTNYLGI